MSRNPMVDIKSGKIRGTTVKNVDGGEYLAFDGIPFAEPPLGELRFKDPVPSKPWYGVRDLNTAVPKPTQYDMVLEFYTGTEDCLYLNVATRSLVGKRPVMVWIHGGGFIMGTASRLLYGADYFLRQDVVIVTVGYRLGCFGFLNLDLPEASGNQGLKDQVAALIWIQQNIAAFGGDPENVTLFGESAGASCVHLITMSPLTKGLYHKVILQSGQATSSWSFCENPLEDGLRLAGLVRGSSVDDPAEALKIVMKASTDELIKAQTKINLREKYYQLVFSFIPSIDRTCPNPFMPVHPSELTERGINAPLIIGVMSDEGIVCTLEPNLKNIYREIKIDFPTFLARALKICDVERVAKIADSVKKYYFGELETIESPTHDCNYAQLMGDVHFYNGAQRVIELQKNVPTPTYVYRFSYIPSYPTVRMFLKNDMPGVTHSEELGAMFHSQCYMGSKGLKRGSKDYLTMERVTRMWANFAKTGNPTDKIDDITTVKWEPMGKEKINYIDIGDKVTSGEHFEHSSWKFWKSILEKL